MEGDLAAFPEADNFDEEEPYLEAKLYIERVEQENNRCQDRDRTQNLTSDGSEPLEHGVSITMYPVRVPSVHFSCATVQWDVPQASSDVTYRESDTIGINSSYGSDMDWAVNPSSLVMPLVNQEDIIDLVQDKEPQPRDDGLQHRTAIKVVSFQVHDEVDVCVTPSNGDDQTPFTETTKTLKANDDELVDFEKIGDQTESPVNTEIPSNQLDPSALEVFDEDTVETENSLLLAEPEQKKEDEVEKINSEDGTRVVTMISCEKVCTTIQQLETNDAVLEVDPKSKEATDIIQESDSLQPEGPPELVYDAVESVETKESKNVEFYALSTTLENVEMFVKLQESVLEVKQKEVNCEDQIDNAAEVEPQKHKGQLTEQSECLDDMKNESKQESLLEETSEFLKEEDYLDEECLKGSKREGSLAAKPLESEKQDVLLEEEHSQGSEQALSIGEGVSEESNQLDCNKTENLDQANETKSTVEIEANQNHNETEIMDQYGRSSNTTQSQLSKFRHSQETNHSDQLQETKKQNYTNSEQQQQTEEVSSKHVYVTKEQLEESAKPVICDKSAIKEAVDKEGACKLAERLYRLDHFQRTDVVRHLDKDNAFSRAVGEEYLKFFDFTGQSLDEALRSFLKEVVLIGETQERERVLDHFSRRYQWCNPEIFSSTGAVLTLTCAIMLLNTDLHGQNVGKAMSLPVFVSNLDGMNEGDNFSKDLLKALYNSIKNHPLEWAVEEKELLNLITLEQDSDLDASLRSKSNPFQDLAHDKRATVFQKGFLRRKAHADIDGKRTPWGKRSWKTFYAVLKGMVLYLQKDEYRKDWQSSEEVLSVHHALAERAEDYTKRPHVFRLQTADWRVFLFEAQSTEQMNCWIGRINLVSALYSSPPFPAAVGSQRKFCRPILPATQSALTLEKQLQSHAAMLQSFQEDLSALQQGAQESRKAKARELEECRQREEYLQHERSRYEVYIHVMDVWQNLGKSLETVSVTDLALFDQELWKGADNEEKEDSELDGGIKRSHSSPSLKLEVATPPVVKVRRNISERRTYRKIIIPRRNREV